MIMGREKEFVGVITFYRTLGKDNFQYDDIFILDMLKDHLAFRLYKYKKSGDLAEEKLTVSAAVEKFGLTRREHTILKMLMEGKDNHEISTDLTITENTLKKHILNIYRKLGIKKRSRCSNSLKKRSRFT